MWNLSISINRCNFALFMKSRSMRDGTETLFFEAQKFSKKYNFSNPYETSSLITSLKLKICMNTPQVSVGLFINQIFKRAYPFQTRRDLPPVDSSTIKCPLLFVLWPFSLCFPSSFLDHKTVSIRFELIFSMSLYCLVLYWLLCCVWCYISGILCCLTCTNSLFFSK